MYSYSYFIWTLRYLRKFQFIPLAGSYSLSAILAKPNLLTSLNTCNLNSCPIHYTDITAQGPGLFSLIFHHNLFLLIQKFWHAVYTEKRCLVVLNGKLKEKVFHCHAQKELSLQSLEINFQAFLRHLEILSLVSVLFVQNSLYLWVGKIIWSKDEIMILKKSRKIN